MARKRAASTRKTAAGRPRKGFRWEGVPSLKDHRREAILRSVANALRNSRLSSLTIQKIADELGMTKGNLYYYFKNKQEILFYCHMRSMEISLLALHEATQSCGSPAAKLRILLTYHIRGVIDEGFGAILQTDLESLNAERRKQYVRKRDELERGVRRLIEEGVRIGEFECRNVKLTGFAILGAINWVPKWYHPSGAFTPKQIAEELTGYFLRGLMQTARVVVGAPRARASDELADRQRRQVLESER
jgi:AcrR family transcriptional regulator